MLKTRVLTALIALPLFILSVSYLPPWCIMLLFLASVILSTYEVSWLLIPTTINACAQLSGIKEPVRTQRRLIYISITIAAAIFLASVFGGFQAGRGMIVFGILGTMMLGAFSGRNIFLAVGAMMAAITAICYGAMPWLAVWDLYLFDRGPRYLWFLFGIVWGGDTGAYFAGRFWGKTPLSAKSPKKTWEGAIGGIAASIICAVLINVYYDRQIAPLSVVVFSAIFGGIFAQLGDLLESSFKRFAQVKDSGLVFPGHGGFLDRVDGVLFAAPVIWFILYVSEYGFDRL